MATDSLPSDLVTTARTEADRAIAQGYHYGHPSALVGCVRDLCNEVERLRSALESSARGRREFQALCREMLARVEKLP